MTKTLLAFVLFSFFLCRFALSASAAPTYGTATSAAAEDAAGTVWALPDYFNRDDKIRRWQRGAWVNVAVPETRGFRLLALTRSADGNVYGLWQRYTQKPSGEPQCLVTTQHGTRLRALALFDGAVVRENGFPNTPRIDAGASGDVWVVGFAPTLWHITPNGAVQTFPFRAEWYTEGKLPSDYESSADQTPRLNSSAAGAERRLFWENKLPFGQQNSLRGLLLWNGKTLSPAPALTGTAGERVSRLFPLDANHVWMSVDQEEMNWPHTVSALYQLDTRTFQAVREPLPAALQFIVQIFQASGDWYAAEGKPYNAVTPALWRKRGGVWRKEIAVLEEPGGYWAADLRHPWLAEPAGLWLGVSGGAWWLPSNSAPVWVNWRRGLPAQTVSGLFPLPGGRMLTFGENLGSTELSAAPQPVRPLPPGVSVGGRGAPANLGLPPLADPRRHLWGLPTFYRGAPALYEWDGIRWRAHLPPSDIPGIGSLYAVDTLGRVWLSTSNWHPPAQPQPVEGRAVYDPARDTWTNYATVPEALSAAAALPGMAFLPHHGFYQPPAFSGDGRVAYVDNNTKVFLYDGKSWRHWDAGDILAHRYQWGGLGDAPHFNAGGHLEVSLPYACWEWTPGTGWQLTGAQRDTRDPNPVPPGGPGGLTSNPPKDSLGVQWFVWQDAVYTAGYGLWAKQPELSAPGSPFALGFGIEDVLRDPAGRLFFVSRPTGRSEMVVWSPPPVPKPSVSVTPLSEDSVSVRFQSAISGPHRFLWRVNGGAWSAPTTAGTLMLSALPRGDYRLEVQALDSRLQVSPAVVAVWSVRVDQETQIARWVSVLSAGPDDAREIAVAGLVNQPAAALPALKTARPAASEIGKWWIDAAIQQITDAQQIAAGETPKIAN